MEWNLKQTLAHMLLSISINPTIPLFASLQVPGIFALGVRAEGQQLAPWLPLWWRCTVAMVSAYCVAMASAVFPLPVVLCVAMASAL